MSMVKDIESASSKVFFKELFCLSPEENSILAKEAIRLISILDEEFMLYFHEIESIIGGLNTYVIQEGNGSLKSVFERLKAEGVIGEYYFQTFISTDFEPSWTDFEKLEQYKALTFIVAIRQCTHQDVESRISTMCSEIRQLALGNRAYLRKLLPDILSLSYISLLSELEKLKDNENSLITDEAVLRQFASLYIPFSSALEKSIGIARTAKHNLDHISELKISSIKSLDDSIDFNASIIAEMRFDPKGQKNFAKEEALSDIDRKLAAITMNSDESHFVKQKKANAIYARLKKRSMHLPCDIYSASEYEISVLIKSCNEAFDSVNEPCARLLLLSLVLGNTTKQVRNRKLARSEHREVVGIQRQHKLPSHLNAKFCNNVQITTEVSKVIVLPLPEKIINKLSNIRFSNVTDEMLQQFIKEVNKKNNTHLSLVKISNYLQQTFTKKNYDPVIQAVIRGEDLDKLVALYYVQLNVSDVLNLFYRYINYLSGHGDHKQQEIFQIGPAMSDMEEKLGSQLFIETRKLQCLFAVLQSELKAKLRQSGKAKFSSDTHNLLTVYVQIILALSSGYRPVTGWFGRLSHINLDNHQYWISDKETQQVNTCRTIILPDICIQIINKYLRYVEQSIAYYQRQNIELCERYQAVLTSAEHFTFFINGNRVEEIRPKTYEAQIKDKLPLQLNWQRHHIRSYLAHEEIDHELISGWMGHSDIGGGLFSSCSSCSFREMQLIADSINTLLTEILGEGI